MSRRARSFRLRGVAPLAGTLLLSCGLTMMSGVLPAMAASGSTVAYGPGASQCGSAGYCWAPATVTINPGDSVNFSVVGYHGLNEVSGAWPAGCPQGSAGSCGFAFSGSYAFNCSVHGNLMKGAVVVTGNVHPPTPAPTHSSAPPAPAPTRSQPAPQQSLAAPRPAPAASSAPTPTPQAVALAPSPSPSDSASPTPSATPIVAPTPASSTSSGGTPLPILALVAIALVAGAAGLHHWYRRRPAL